MSFNFQNKGFVKRASDEEDKRGHRIFLTEKGKQIRSDVLGAVIKVLGSSIDGVDIAELQITKKVIKQIISNLTDLAE